MFINSNGFSFENIEELNYNLLNAVGLSTLPNGNIVDREIGNAQIKFDGKNMKANIDPNNIHYAGEGEIMLDVLSNLKMSIVLLGHLLDKNKYFDDKEIYSYYTEELEVDCGLKKTQLVIMFIDKSTVASNFYYNKSLAYIDAIFKLEDSIEVDLSNFDIPPTIIGR